MSLVGEDKVAGRRTVAAAEAAAVVAVAEHRMAAAVHRVPEASLPTDLAPFQGEEPAGTAAAVVEGERQRTIAKQVQVPRHCGNPPVAEPAEADIVAGHRSTEYHHHSFAGEVHRTQNLPSAAVQPPAKSERHPSCLRLVNLLPPARLQIQQSH